MTLSSLLLGIWLVLFGVDQTGMAVVSHWLLGIWALITGVLWLFDLYHPLTIWRRP